MEATINKVELSGYVGLSPEIKEFENGGMIARVSLATNERYKNKEGNWVEDTTWHKIVFRNKDAKEVSQKVMKGTRLNVLGKLTNRSWQDQNGTKHYITEVMALDYAILEGKDLKAKEVCEQVENDQAEVASNPSSKKKKI